MASSEETSLLVLGGLGFIGRHFVKYVLDYGLATRVRIVDKAVPSMAFLSPEFAALLERPDVEVMQKHLARDEHVADAFAPSKLIPDGRFQMVVNLAAETRYGQSDAFYAENVTQVRVKCAERAAAAGVDKYIEVSTVQVYEGKSTTPAKESDKLKPWTSVAKAHLAAEAAVLGMAGLDATVLRLPIVYGPGDKSGLMPRLAVAAVYAHTGDTMELLWGEDLRLHTAHVQDAGACIYHLLCSGARGDVYNLVDKCGTTQGSLCKQLEAVFPKLKTGYVGTVLSSMAQLGLDELVDAANDGHMAPWDELCRAGKVGYTPLTPWLDKELLYKHHTAVDGSKLEATGFEVSCPAITKELLVDSLRYWIDLGKFPPLETV